MSNGGQDGFCGHIAPNVVPWVRFYDTLGYYIPVSRPRQLAGRCEDVTESRNIPGLSPEELAARKQQYQPLVSKNTVVIHENDPADSLFVIESGKVKVYLQRQERQGIHHEHPGRRRLLGELALLDDSNPLRLGAHGGKIDFLHHLQGRFQPYPRRAPGIGRKLIRNLSQRVRKLTADVKSLALQDVYGRVANVLMDLSEERGDGTLYIPEKLTQQDIADRVGASARWWPASSRISRSASIFASRDAHHHQRGCPPSIELIAWFFAACMRVRVALLVIGVVCAAEIPLDVVGLRSHPRFPVG